MFTAQELQNITNAALDFHMDKGKVHSQTIQDKPLLRCMKKNRKMFPGGKDNITVRVKGVYSTALQGFTHDDVVTYVNPANIKTAIFPWKEAHAGISFTGTELKKDGISVVDSLDGKRTSEHSDREMTALANLLDDKLEDMSEGYSRGLNDMFWKDGVATPKLSPGILSFITDNPSSAVLVGGIDQSLNTWWRNRAFVGANAAVGNSIGPAIAVGADATKQILIIKLNFEIRQLRRYGGKPSKMFCGSDFLDQIEKELRANGTYTQTGWKSTGRIDLGMSDVELKGVVLEYDPTLDDLGYAKRGYIIDESQVFPMVMEGEEDKRHSPARPEDKYVYYRAVTWTGGMVCRRRNSSGVYEFV